MILTGCTASAPAAQTSKQGCKVLEGDLTSSASALTTAFSSLQSDPKGAEQALAKFDTALTASTAKVTNAKVKAAATATVKAIGALDSGLKAYIKDSSNTKALTSAAQDVQTTFNKLGTICTS